MNTSTMLPRIYEQVSTLCDYLTSHDVDLTNVDQSFRYFAEQTFLAGDRNTSTPPPIGEIVEDYEDLLLRFIRSAMRKSKEKEVLTFGLQSGSESTTGLCRSEHHISKPLFRVTYNHQAITKANWRKLHQLTGDDFLFHLFKTKSIFKHSDFGPLIQISGLPIYEKMKNMKSEPSAKPPEWLKLISERIVARRTGKANKILNRKVIGNETRKRKRLEPEIDAECVRSKKRRKLDTPNIFLEEPKNKQKNRNKEQMSRKEKEEKSHKKQQKDQKEKKKPTRRSKKKRKHSRRDHASEHKKEKEEPYDYKMVINQNVYLHAKNHREWIPVGHFPEHCTGAELISRVLEVRVFEAEKKKSGNSLVKKGNIWLSLDTKRSLRKRSDPKPVDPNHTELVELLDQVVKNHRKMLRRSVHLVDFNCPVPKSTHLETMSTAQLLELFSPLMRVYLFLRRIICLVIPGELFGSKRNKDEFLSFLYKIIGLRKGEKASVGLLMYRIHTKDAKWTDKLSSVERQRMMAKFLTWTLHYAFMLVRSFFYVTATSSWKNRIFFYRKRLWRELHRRGMSDVINKGIFHLIPRTTAMDMIGKGLSLGYAPIRFMPKTTSMRPLINLAWKPTMGELTDSSINQRVNPIFLVLQDICRANPQLIGYGLLNMDMAEFSERYLKFVRGNTSDKLYYVKADIKNCFDRIDQRKLMGILHSVLQFAKHHYTIKRYASVSDRRGKLGVRYHRQMSDQPFPKVAQNVPESAIIVDQVYYPSFDIDELMRTLQCHLLFNLVNANGVFYHQVNGISQGSVLSSLLCNIYCGDFERQYVHVQEHELIVRQVDDYLYITPHVERAREFAKLICEGSAEYNIQANCHKTVVNFQCENVNEASRPVVTDSNIIRWCGIVIDLDTFHVAPDYWRYEGQNLDDAICAEYIQNPAAAMKRKVAAALPNKLLTVFYHPDVSSHTSVLRNVFELSVYIACVFASLHGKLGKFKGQKEQNLAFMLSIITMVAIKIRNSLDSVPKPETSVNVYPHFDEVKFVVFTAFLRKLRERRFHSDILKGLQSLIETQRNKIDEERLKLINNIVDHCMKSDPYYYR